MQMTDLTEKQRLVLVNTVEESTLFSLLDEYAPGEALDEKLPYVAELSPIVLDFLDKGLISLYRNSDEPSQPFIDIPDNEAHTLLTDPRNWWTPDDTHPISLAPTDKGLALYQGQEIDA
jgi:hypothetical protein